MTNKLSLAIKLLSVILSIGILLVSLPVCFLVVNGNDITELEQMSEEKEEELVRDAYLEPFDIPEVVSLEELRKRTPVERLREEEQSLCEVVFANEDGTWTSFLYGVPVKYTLEDGTIRDKSLFIADLAISPDQGFVGRMEEDLADCVKSEFFAAIGENYRGNIKESDLRYATLDNDVRTAYGSSSAVGVVAGMDDYMIRMLPVGEASEVSLAKTYSRSDGEERERIIYPGVFGADTCIQYVPTLNGIKEDIVLLHTVERNEFSFRVETSGVILTEDDGSVVFLAANTGEYLGCFREILSFDCDGNISRGSLTVTETENNDQYLITITVDPEFLQSASFPVYIDPSFYLYPSGVDPDFGSYTFIEDVSIYNDPDAQGYTFIEWHQIGEVLSSGYYGQAAFRFPALYDSTLMNGYASLTAEQIGSFSLHLKSCSGTASTNILKASTYVPTWPNTFKVFSSAYYNYFNGTQYDVTQNNVPVNSTFSIDLTGMARHWKNIQYGLEIGYLGTAETGVLLWNGGGGTIWLESCEYSSDIYAVLDYDVGYSSAYLNNKDTGEFLGYYLGELEHINGRIQYIGEEIDWKIEYKGIDAITGNKTYTIRDNNEGCQYLSYIVYGSTYEPVLSNSPAYWAISTAPGGGCYIKVNDSANKYLGIDEDQLVLSTDLSSSQKCWRIVGSSSYSSRELASFTATIANLDVDDSAVPTFVSSPSIAYWTSYTDFAYYIPSTAQQYVSYDETTHRLTALASGTVSIQAIHKVTGLTCNLSIKVNKNAVIVIPGFMASELFVGENNPYFLSGSPLISKDMYDLMNLFVDENVPTEIKLACAVALLSVNEIDNPLDLVAYVNAYYNSIKCNANGTSQYEVYTKKYVYVEPTYAPADTGHNNPFYNLPQSYDSRYYSPYAGTDNSYYKLMAALHADADVCRQYSIEFFSYDWRLSNAVSAQRLDAFINENHYDKVILIAHSMGGLVASGYMALGETQRSKVKDSIMLAAPLLGLPEVINLWANLDLSSLFSEIASAINIVNLFLGLMTLTINPFQQLISNYPSVYETMPTEQYINIGLTPYIVYSQAQLSGPGGGITNVLCEDYASSKSVLINFLPYYNAQLMASAELFHNACYVNGVHVSDLLNSKYYYSSSRKVNTKLRCSKLIYQELDVFVVEIESFSIVGDGLVPFWSATLGNSGGNVFPKNGADHMSFVDDVDVIEDVMAEMG